MPKRSYLDTPSGQIHLHCWGTPSAQPTLMGLHSSPYSGILFDTIAPLLSKDRHFIAPDYPGYGGSSALEKPASIADYADAIAHAITAHSPHEPVDVLGFHTGSLVAVETALTHPQLVRRVILIDIPFFSEEDRKHHATTVTVPTPLCSNALDVQGIWDRVVASSLHVLSLSRAQDFFIEEMRSKQHRHEGFKAAFAYPYEERFKLLKKPTTVIASNSYLHDITCKAARTIANAKLVEHLNIETAIMDLGAEIITPSILKALA